MARNVTIEEADGHLDELIKLAEGGEEIVIVQGSQPKVRLVPVAPSAAVRVFGQYRGKIDIAPDFDAPLPEEFWLGSSR